jgi:hypothetical protein
MTLMRPDSDRLAWERQIGEPPRPFEAFRAFADLPPSQRTLAKTAEIVGKSRNLLKHWSAEYDWVMRAEIWDRAQQRVADAARLEEIDRINRKAVEVGEAMLDAVIAHISAAAKALDRSPHALARWAEVGAKLSRDGLGVGERTHSGRRPECARPARIERHSGPLDAGSGAASQGSGADVD